MLEIKKVLLIGIIIFSISIGVVFLVIIGSDSQRQSTSQDSIDISFDKWEISGTGDDKYIEDKGDYIEVYDDSYRSNIQARLDFDLIVSGSFKFQYKLPDLNKIGAFHMYVFSGDLILFTISRPYNNFGRLIASYPDSGLIIIASKDTNWHSIELSFELNGDNSNVSLKVDGVTKIDSGMFSTSKIGVNNIRIVSGTFAVPNLTHLKLEELIKFN